ncbi:MAG: hypothetical protein WC802_05255 [Patescibacteria group bacterium]|jgi:hypothetical protein
MYSLLGVWAFVGVVGCRPVESGDIITNNYFDFGSDDSDADTGELPCVLRHPMPASASSAGSLYPVQTDGSLMMSGGETPATMFFTLQQECGPQRLEIFEITARIQGDYAHGPAFEALESGVEDGPGHIGVAHLGPEAFTWVNRPYGYSTWDDGTGTPGITEIRWVWSSSSMPPGPNVGSLDPRIFSGGETVDVALQLTDLDSIVPVNTPIDIVVHVTVTDLETGNSQILSFELVLWYILPPHP